MTSRKPSLIVVPQQPALRPPDPEVLPKASRRTFSAAEKLRILNEADACTQPGQIGALLRREGLYSSHLVKWRRLRAAGQLQALTPQPRGPKPAPPDPLTEELAQVRAENARLHARLTQAELIIDVQKKVAQLLGASLPTPRSDERS
jgi:transposase-like protein